MATMASNYWTATAFHAMSTQIQTQTLHDHQNEQNKMTCTNCNNRIDNENNIELTTWNTITKEVIVLYCSKC